MAKKNQKIKILYLLKVFEQKTDKEHQLTINEIIDELLNYGISAERKSIYSDIKALKEANYPIVMTKSKDVTYYLEPVSLDFSDIKIITDALQAATFVSRRKSNEIIGKLESYTNEYNIPKLQRRMLRYNKNIIVNENSYEAIDLSYEAINEKKKLFFIYSELGEEDKEYTVSPYMMTWAENNYYLVAGSRTLPLGMKCFRTEYMRDVKVLNVKALDKNEVTNDQDFNIIDFIDKSLNFSPQTVENICLKIHNTLIVTFLDKFAPDKFAGNVEVKKIDEDYFLLSFSIEITPQFLVYLFKHDGMTEIISPVKLKERMQRINQKIHIVCNQQM